MKHLIFIDIDGTLLDAHYGVNFPRLTATIDSLEKSGYVFGLNSNRSLIDMVPVAEKFHINGPLVSENGVFYLTRNHKKKRMLISEEEAVRLKETKKAFEGRLHVLLDAESKDGCVWEDIDTVDLISHEAVRTLPVGTVFVANNMYREYTTSAHIFVQTERGLEHAEASLIDKLCDSMSQWANDHQFEVARGYEFANILGFTKITSKRAAIEKMKRERPLTRISAIGNELSDALMISGIGDFYAVKNAMAEAREIATCVSRYETAEGVDEILRKIATDENG